MKKILLIGFLSVALIACGTRKKMVKDEVTQAEQTEPQKVGAVAPPVYVYKTKKDYSQYVPVMLSEDRSRIVSYPDPTDVRRGSGYATPSPLKNGYWYDNRGIGECVAFTRYTYEEYAQLPHPPSITELYDSILDKYPLLELWSCKRTSPDEINTMLENGTFTKSCQMRYSLKNQSN